MRPSIARRFKLATMALVLLGLGASGCGSDSDDETTPDTEAAEAQKAEVEKAGKITTPIDASDVVKALPPALVRDGDIEAEKQGTPQRSFLEWWQAFQFHDSETVETLTSKATLDAIGASELKQLVGTTTLGGVEVLDVSESGSSARIRAGLLTFSPPKGGGLPDKPTSSTPATFALRKEDGEWLFNETEYLQLRLDNLNE